MTQKTLVLGLGNTLLRDEGLGVRAIERIMATYASSDEIELLDGGTLGLDLLPRLDGVGALILIDAVRAGEPPGTLIRLEGESIQAALAVKLSVHQVGLQELLAVSAFRGSMPARVLLLGLEPEVVEWGMELTPAVAAALDLLVAAVVRELHDWGVILTKQNDRAS